MGRITVLFAAFAPAFALAQVDGAQPLPEPSAIALITAGVVVAGLANRLARNKKDK